MRIENRTDWRTDHIAAFVRRALDAEEIPQAQRRHLRVVIEYERRNGVAGRAAVGGHWMMLRLPRPETEIVEGGERSFGTLLLPSLRKWMVETNRIAAGARFDPNCKAVSFEARRLQFAHTCVHEAGHLRGLRHRSMSHRCEYSYRPGWEATVAWANDLPLEWKPKGEKASVEAKRAVREDHSRKMVRLWDARARRAAARLKKWKARLRSQERVRELAAKSRSGAKGGAR